jgi:hypothetical protein
VTSFFAARKTKSKPAISQEQPEEKGFPLFFRLLFIILSLIPRFPVSSSLPGRANFSHLLNPEGREKARWFFPMMPRTATPPLRQTLPKALHFDVSGRKLF